MNAATCARLSTVVRTTERQSRAIGNGDIKQALDPRAIGERGQYDGLPRPSYVKEGARVWRF
ncbi:MAG: hypothetical protein HYT21_00850 [Candidatus Nealsonbacteria bacterium]|nr:hypothetical protein [Candidatus Nealsonbacteria bacterium]